MKYVAHEPEVTLELALQHGLTSDEYDRILSILGRTPTYTELGIYSVMWSEHCSYKNSIAVLKTLPRSGGRLLVSAGEENAGLVDIGGGLAVAFKIESHNHPSAVEPYQGAATGVGGIMRDIFTMGARFLTANSFPNDLDPILLNFRIHLKDFIPLRGRSDEEAPRSLLQEVVFFLKVRYPGFEKGNLLIFQRSLFLDLQKPLRVTSWEAQLGINVELLCDSILCYHKNQ